MLRNLCLLLMCFPLLTVSCSDAKKMEDVPTVSGFDPDKYLGKWYEIARITHGFEKGIVAGSATYTRWEDGLIRVINSGLQDSLGGEKTYAIGKAKIPDPSVPSHLEVSFFWFFYSAYNVLAIDPDYTVSLVGGVRADYLWILARAPQISKEAYDTLVNKARTLGYDISLLELPIQINGEPPVK